MIPIAFIDTETDPVKKRLLDIGCIRGDGAIYHSASLSGLPAFLGDTAFIAGHNILRHDVKYIADALERLGGPPPQLIDTLFLSPLLFPSRPYHKLVKDDKLQTEELSNPVNDAIKARGLFHDEEAAFSALPVELRQAYRGLLANTYEFAGFFRYVAADPVVADLPRLIQTFFEGKICTHSPLAELMDKDPIALAYCLALIHSGNSASATPPWVLYHYPATDRAIALLRGRPCKEKCGYCLNAMDMHRALRRFFGFEQFRNYGGQPLQEKAAEAAVLGESILAVFPTGGGKSLTFQLPALMAAANTSGLTVVISPLQSLMKDQVDNLEKQGITEAVTINGLLDPIERSKAIERVAEGSASMLYISPESLRSRTIEHLLLGRKIERFVIDEAHCFSAWGQDFRVDYLYIGDFIKSLQEKKRLQEAIPVSCFTATAKRKVMEDIQAYFREKLQLELQVFRSDAARTNLHYGVYEKTQDEDKYSALRNLLELRDCPAIVYVSRTKKTEQLAERLARDGFSALPYHGKMEAKDKTANQDAFMAGQVKVIVATSAFGMGVDKKDVGIVVHYEISDSLENYVQEAGRAGRDENITADCFILFDEDDLGKHLELLNRSRLSINEIKQVWGALKKLTKFRNKISYSALEIARKAGWDDTVGDIETRVVTAVAALEDSGYIQRGQNAPRVFATSILARNMQEASDRISASGAFSEKEKEQSARIVRKLFSSRSRGRASEEGAESRVDYIADQLGIPREEVARCICLMRQERILADDKDLSAFIRRDDSKKTALTLTAAFCTLELELFKAVGETEQHLQVKSLNEQFEAAGVKQCTPNKIKTVLNFWAIKSWIRRQYTEHTRNHFIACCTGPKEQLGKKLEARHVLARFVIEYLFNKAAALPVAGDKQEDPVEFSVHELTEAFNQSPDVYTGAVTARDIEDTLFFLSRIEALKIEGGFLVIYHQLQIERKEMNSLRNYKAEDYQKLNQFYKNKVQQIHIAGEYARKMIHDYEAALLFVEDYFTLPYPQFLNRYFNKERQKEISQNVTPAKFNQLFGTLSLAQMAIIRDDASKYIAVAAGPGSGKTKLLAHKLASLLLMEDVRHEQLLMLTFSRAAASEFKKRLLSLIGPAALFVEIKTFHSYCFDLLGRIGTLEKSDDIIRDTVQKIKDGEVEASQVTKTVLVIDEAQDMNFEEFALVEALMAQNEEMRVIAVGDDDQNIFAFRGADARYMSAFIRQWKATKYELAENYRSKNNLVAYANNFVQTISQRLKESPLSAHQDDDGTIAVTYYDSQQLVQPVAASVASLRLPGSTCALTATNEEALQLTCSLLELGIRARLIQSNEGFSLYNLREARFFVDALALPAGATVIPDENWAQARALVEAKLSRSTRLDICRGIIRVFEETNPRRKYFSDLEGLIRESKPEDFLETDNTTVVVSTMHKAKGKEFDNVFLLLQGYDASSDEKKRQLYVALTRAKNNLSIHTNTGCVDGIKAEGCDWRYDHTLYAMPGRTAVQLNLKEVWLDYFGSRQYLIKNLLPGDTLTIGEPDMLLCGNTPILKFSRAFLQRKEAFRAQGYQLASAKINFVVWWKNDTMAQEVLAILPELIFEKTAKNQP